MEAPRPDILRSLTLRVEALERADADRKDALLSLSQQFGRMMTEVSRTRDDVADVKAVAHRLERNLIAGTVRTPAPSQHDLESVAKRAAKETAEEITDRHLIPIPGARSLSERVRETITNERNATVAGGVAKVVLAVVISLALLGTGMALRDCQHGTVPTNLH